MRSLRAGLPRRLRDSLNDARGRISRFERHADHPAAPAFDDLAADHVLLRPVGPFDQHIRLQPKDELVGRLLVEEDDAVHAVESGKYLRSLAFGRDGASLAFDGAHRSVGVDAYDEGVAQTAGVPEVTQVAGVEEVEHAVGEDDAFAAAPDGLDPGDRLVRRKDRHRLYSLFVPPNCTSPAKVQRWRGR